MNNTIRGRLVWEERFLPLNGRNRIYLTPEEARVAVIKRMGDAVRSLPIASTWPQSDIRFVQFPGDLLIATLEVPNDRD